MASGELPRPGHRQHRYRDASNPGLDFRLKPTPATASDFGLRNLTLPFFGFLGQSLNKT